MPHVLLRLAYVDLRSRRMQTALILLVIGITAATATIALALRQTADQPWDRTFAATNGAHAWLIADRPGVNLAGAADLPGVTQSIIVPFVDTSFVERGHRVGLMLEARAEKRGGIDSPVVTSGTWIGPGSIVVERSFARQLGLRVGQKLHLATTTGTRAFTIAGIAVSSGQRAYPHDQPGVVWTTGGDLASVQPDRAKLLTALGVRLADPNAVDQWALRALAPPRRFSGELVDWRTLRDAAANLTQGVIKVLSTVAVFLLLASGFMLATLVAARVLAESRAIGLLKAVGLTPGQVSRVYLLQYLALGMVGAIAGLVAGWLLAPTFVVSVGQVLNATAGHGVNLPSAAAVVIAIELIVGLFAFVPSRRASEQTAAELVSEARIRHDTRSRLARLASLLRLPETLVLGLKDSFARPGRALLTAFALALSVAAIVAAANVEADWHNKQRAAATLTSPTSRIAQRPQTPVVGPPFRLQSDVWVGAENARVRPILYGAVGLLVLVGVANLLAFAVLGVRERTRDFALLKAIGLTPHQIRTIVAGTHSSLGIVATAVGIPLGLATYRIVGDSAIAPWWILVLIGIAVPAASVATALVPAHNVASRATVADGLRMG